MPITIITQGRDATPWREALKKQRPDLDVRVYPEDAAREEVDFVLVWNHPAGIFNAYPNLKCIASMGAGVDHILKDPELPEGVAITRVTDENLTQDMAEFVVALVLQHVRGLSFYKMEEQSRSWEKKSYLRIKDITIGMMGMGVLGARAAQALTALGFRVNGWTRTAKPEEKIKVYAGEEELDAFLATSDILICLLPLTSQTKDILNKSTFQKLPQNAFVINVARGEHLVEEDLVEMIDTGHLSGASLDVFREEPLPQEHPFWAHPKINITPHIASVTDPHTVVAQLLDNYDRLQRQEPLQNTVSIKKGY